MQLELRPSTAIVPPPAIAFGLPESGIRGSATSMEVGAWSEPTLTRSPRQACFTSCTTNASELGRFLSVDPVTGSLRTPQSWNWYSYVMNNPLNLTDLDGRCPLCIGGLVGGIVGVGIAGYNEIKTSLHQPVTWSGSTGRVLGAFAGGAISGAAATVPGGTAVRLAASISGSPAGGAVNRVISGQQQTVDAAQRDGVGGTVGFAGGEAGAKIATAVAQGVVDSLTVGAAAARADAAAQNLGLGADKAANQAIQNIQTEIKATGVASGETAGNVTSRSLPPSPQAAPPVAAPCASENCKQ